MRRNVLLAATLAVLALAASQALAGPSAGRAAALVFDDTQPGASARVCLILPGRVSGSTSCAAGHGVVAISGLPPGTRSDDVTVANVGDVNGDGFPAYAISDSAAGFAGRRHSGVTWVLFGRAHLTAINLAHLGSAGFAIGGPRAGAQTGVLDQSEGGEVAGDVNGDGLDDIIISARSPDATDANRAWVVFGKRGSGAVDLAALGHGGFVIDGTDGSSPVIVGEVNGGARAAVAVSGVGNGEISVVYGSASGGTVDLDALGSRDFRISGLDPVVGGPIVGVGDLTGDGIDDMLVGNPWSGGECGASAPILAEICPGTAYVIYGERTRENIDVRHLGAHGYTIASPSGSTDGLGASVGAAGDIGDAEPGLLIGDNSHVYVIDGRRGSGAVNLDKAGFGGFVIDFPVPSGIALGPGVGPPVTGITPLRGGAVSDILLEPTAANGTTTSFYVVYPQRSGASVDLAHLGAAGFQIR